MTIPMIRIWKRRPGRRSYKGSHKSIDPGETRNCGSLGQQRVGRARNGYRAFILTSLSSEAQNGSMRPDFIPADPGYAERVRASFDAQPMMSTLGVSITDLGPGWIDLEFDHHEDFTQQHGFKHAGAIATALDSACGYAAFSLMPAEAAVLTVEYKINLLRPAKAERYVASAAVIKPGRTLTVCTGTVAPAGTNGETIAMMTATQMTLIGTDIKH